MSGRGRPPGHFRNQKGFHGVRGRPRDTFTGGGSTATRSAASPSLRSRSLTPASENNAIPSYTFLYKNHQPQESWLHIFEGY